MTTARVPLTEAVQLVLGGKVHNAPRYPGTATYAAAQNNFEGLRPASVWLGVPPLQLGQRREKPENFRNH